MSKRQQKRFDKVYQDFTLRHLLYEPPIRPVKSSKTSVSQPPDFEKSASAYPFAPATRDSPEPSVDLVERALGQTMPTATRKQVVNKALARVRGQESTDQDGLSFSRTAPSPIRLKEESYSKSSAAFQFPGQNLPSTEVPSTSQTPLFREIERSRLLETRLKDLSEKYATLQQNYKELLSRSVLSPEIDYKTKYEDLLITQKRERAALERRIKDLEIEVELAKSTVISQSTPLAKPDASPYSHSPMRSGSGDELFPLFDNIDLRQLTLEVRELQRRLYHAENRIQVLEQESKS